MYIGTKEETEYIGNHTKNDKFTHVQINMLVCTYINTYVYIALSDNIPYLGRLETKNCDWSWLFM